MSSAASFEREAQLLAEELRRASRRLAVASGHLALLSRQQAEANPALARVLGELAESLRIAAAEAADLVGA